VIWIGGRIARDEHGDGGEFAQGGEAIMTQRITIYGIKACDTMKKARAWLDARGVAYAFHDYKIQGIDRAVLQAWANQVGWEVLLNRAGTTFRKLPDSSKANLDSDKAVVLMLAQPSMIKRPVLEAGGAPIVGFTPDKYAAAFGATASHQVNRPSRGPHT
jgi:arsenate reductase (glutaredoxin)